MFHFKKVPPIFFWGGPVITVPGDTNPCDATDIGFPSLGTMTLMSCSWRDALISDHNLLYVHSQ